MPFIRTIRKNHDTSSTSQFEVTGGDLVYTAGGYKIHVFTQTGDADLNVRYVGNHLPSQTLGLNATRLQTEYLVVGGGGASGPLNGGGGAGGYLAGTIELAPGPYATTVGAGGSAGSAGHSPARDNGSSSSFSTVTAFAGAGANNYRTPGKPGQGSGSGAGAWSAGGGGGAGGAGVGTNFTVAHPNNTIYEAGYCTTDQGFPGGICFADSPGNFSGTNGPGGVGITNPISGTAVAYAGGGGGGGHPGVYSIGNTIGGTGGGGPGNREPNTPSSPGTTNTGGGGGGNGHSPDAPGTSGGPGIVIVRYKIK